jgi:hypothetical protein
MDLSQLLLALASSFILGSKSRGTRDNILLSQIREFSFCRLLRLAGLWWKYSTPPPHGIPDPPFLKAAICSSGPTAEKTQPPEVRRVVSYASLSHQRGVGNLFFQEFACFFMIYIVLVLKKNT